jgi:pimeloyl-ACP methyl ester carboxylesterase
MREIALDRMRAVRWIDEELHPGLQIRSFTLRRGSRPIPGTIWSPEEADAEGPLVLIGHGGGGSSREGYVESLARGLVRRAGATCVAIDGPVHGRRRGQRGHDAMLVMLDFSQIWANEPGMTDEMVADWRAVLDAMVESHGLEGRKVGYWGLSMGTLLGLPLVAAEPRIEACVLGLAGLVGPSASRLAVDAPKVRCPSFFVLQWDDELFARASCLELFDALGSADKQLHATLGRHGAVTSETFKMTARFLGQRLREDRG